MKIVLSTKGDKSSFPFQLKRSQVLMNSYNDFRSERMLRSLEILAAFRQVDLSIKKERIPAAKNLLNRYKLAGLHKFKLFGIAGFSVNEKNLSDAIQAILDPNQTHGLGIIPLMNVLKAIRHRNPSKISFIMRKLNTKDNFIVLEREKNEKDTIPDISISSKTFLIFMENKKRYGAETFLHNSYQTQRQWKRLVLRGRKKGISENGILGIYLTPEGYNAKDCNFVPLYTRELASAVRETVRMSNNCPCKEEIYAFLNYYDWE